MRELERIQAIVAFCYSHPHPTFGNAFFAFEHSSLAIFSPEPVSVFLVRPEHHVNGHRTGARQLGPKMNGTVSLAITGATISVTRFGW